MKKKLKQKKCRACKDLFQPQNGFHVACTPKCAIALAKIKAEKTKDKEFRQRKEALKSRGDWIKELQVVFNKYIRLRDKDLPCISCQNITNDDNLGKGSRWDAGHYLSRGARANLRFNEDNTNKQCVRCNLEMSGNVGEYRINLIKKIGVERVEKLETDYSEARWTIDQLKALKELYKLRIKNLESE